MAGAAGEFFAAVLRVATTPVWTQGKGLCPVYILLLLLLLLSFNYIKALISVIMWSLSFCLHFITFRLYQCKKLFHLN